MWDAVHRAWMNIQLSPGGNKLDAWRVIWQRAEDILPRAGFFRLRYVTPPSYFVLFPQGDISQNLGRFRNILLSITMW